MDAIQKRGLLPGRRQHVHFSAAPETAGRVGRRRGRPIVLTIDTHRMHADGYPFYQSQNGAWLTDHVPPQHLSLTPPGSHPEL